MTQASPNRGSSPASPSNSGKGSPTSSSQPASLQDICWKAVRAHITANNVLALLSWAEQFNMPEMLDLRKHCMRYVMMAFELLRERKGADELRAVLDPATLSQLEAAVEERTRISTTLKAVLGRVVDPPPAPPSSLINTPSVAGHEDSYTYAALVAGVAWPEGVNATAREAHMCPAEFLEVFGMSWEQYCGLPSWKRLVLKQQHRLF